MDGQAGAARPPGDTHKKAGSSSGRNRSCPGLVAYPGPPLGPHFAPAYHILFRNMGRSGDGDRGCPSFYCLASICLSISVFLHPMKTYPLPCPSWHCPSADDGRISELNIPSPPTPPHSPPPRVPQPYFHEARRWHKNDFSLLNNCSSF